MGRIAVGLFLLVVFCTSWKAINYGSQQAKDMVIFYPLNEQGGLVAYDYYINNNNKDTLRGNAIYKGGAIELDGSGDFVSVLPNSRHVISDRFTISLWMWAANLTQSSKHLFSKVNAGFTDNNYAILWEYAGEPDQVSFYAGGYSGTNPRTGSQMTIPSANVWHHVVYTYNGANLRGYLNGVLKINVSTTFSLSTATNSFLSLGGNYQFGNQFAGRLKDIRMYNRGLASEEVMSLFLFPNLIYAKSK